MKNILLTTMVLLGLGSCAPGLSLSSDDALPTDPTTGAVEISKNISTTLGKAALYDATQRYIVGKFTHPKSVRMYESKETGKIYLHWTSYARMGKKDGHVKYSVYFDLADQKASVAVSNICFEATGSYNCKPVERYLTDGLIEKPRQAGNTKEYNSRVVLRKKIIAEVRSFIAEYEALLKKIQ